MSKEKNVTIVMDAGEVGSPAPARPCLNGKEYLIPNRTPTKVPMAVFELLKNGNYPVSILGRVASDTEKAPASDGDGAGAGASLGGGSGAVSSDAAAMIDQNAATVSKAIREGSPWNADKLTEIEAAENARDGGARATVTKAIEVERAK